MPATIQPATLSFFKDLIKNNTREWFTENKGRYDAARQNFLSFLEELLVPLSELEPYLKEQKAKDVVFRIYRDVRFSHDKRPYKNHFGAYFAPKGRKSVEPGYYLHLSPGQSFLAGGVWMPPAPQLTALRQEIDYNWEEFQQIMQAPAFRKHFKDVEGDTLKTSPKGYSADHPAIRYLRLKSFNVSHALTDKQVTSAGFQPYAVEVFSAMKPLNDFFCAHFTLKSREQRLKTGD